MNCNTGELRRFNESLSNEEREAFFREFIEVPRNLQAEAEKELGDKDGVFVDMKKASPLVDWAKRNQPHPNGNRKHRRQMAKQSRKKNR